MKGKKQFNIFSLKGKKLENALSIIDSDIEYIGTGKKYWLSVPCSIENVCRFIRFPGSNSFAIEFDNTNDHIITNVIMNG